MQPTEPLEQCKLTLSTLRRFPLHKMLRSTSKRVMQGLNCIMMIGAKASFSSALRANDLSLILHVGWPRVGSCWNTHYCAMWNGSSKSRWSPYPLGWLWWERVYSVTLTAIWGSTWEHGDVVKSGSRNSWGLWVEPLLLFRCFMLATLGLSINVFVFLVLLDR